MNMLKSAWSYLHPKVRTRLTVFTLVAMSALAGYVGPQAVDVSINPSPALGQPPVIVEALDPSLEPIAYMWRDEISRRFTNAVGIVVHGGDFVEDQWIVGTHLQPWKHVTPVQEIVRRYQEKYPDRTIVLVSCNPGHLKLGIPGVYYAKANVWIVPDRQVTVDMYKFGTAHRTFKNPKGLDFRFLESRSESDPDVVGNIFEFVTDAD